MKYLFLLLIPFFLLSCQREVDEQLPQQTQQELLREIIYFDTTRPVGLDTVDKTTLTYDAQNRLIEMNLSNPDYGHTEMINFRYQGASREAYLMVERYSLGERVEVDSTFLYYLNGVVKADSSISWDKNPPDLPTLTLKTRTARDYLVNGNQVKVSYRTLTYAYVPGNPTVENYEVEETLFTILQSTATVHEERCDVPAGTIEDYYKAVFTGARNPYKGLLPVYPVHLAAQSDGVLGKFEHYWSSEQFGSGPDPYIITYRSQNRPDGLPLYIWQEDNWSPTIFYKIAFIYR
jgi:hypothetical protein